MIGLSKIREIIFEAAHGRGQGEHQGERRAQQYDQRLGGPSALFKNRLLHRRSDLSFVRPALATSDRTIEKSARESAPVFHKLQRALIVATFCVGGAYATEAEVAAPAAVVIESSSSTYARGDSFARDVVFNLAEGERVVLLDWRGEVQTFEVPGSHRLVEEDAREVTVAESALEALFAPPGRAEIGATRDGELDICLNEAKEDPAKTEEDCYAKFGEEEPDVDVETMQSTSVYVAGSSASFVVTSNFDAMMSCVSVRVDQSGDVTVLQMGPAGDDGRPALNLSANVKAYAPVRGGADIKLSDEPGNYKMDCMAVETTAWEEMIEAINAAGGNASAIEAVEFDRMLSAYTIMKGVPHIRRSLDIEIVEGEE